MTLVGLVRVVISTRKTPAIQFAIVVAGVLIAAALRWFIDRGQAGVPFLTFVPVIVLAAIFFDWPFAVFAALASLGTVVGLFGAVARIQFTTSNYILWGAFAFITVFLIGTGHVLRQTILELNAQGEWVRAFNAELQHRTKNTLQIVRVLASRAARSTDPSEFYRMLAGRLDAMIKANELLGWGALKSRDLTELVSAALEPFPTRAIEASGPPCQIGGEPGMQLMMALHELGTNAQKYGALSTDGGRVTLSWSMAKDGVIDLLWREQGGPPVVAPVRLGLGSRILSPSGALRSVDIDYRPEGVTCRMSVASRLGR
jgi:two-component sensor histidine kinase